jgi:magnesium chelatase subunit I
VGQTFQKYLGGEDLRQVIDWFEMGGYLKLPDTTPAQEAWASLKQIEGLFDKARLLGVTPKDAPAVMVAAAEFILDGLAGMKRINRSEERRFSRTDRAHPEIGMESVDTAKRRLN